MNWYFNGYLNINHHTMIHKCSIQQLVFLIYISENLHWRCRLWDRFQLCGTLQLQVEEEVVPRSHCWCRSRWWCRTRCWCGTRNPGEHEAVQCVMPLETGKAPLVILSLNDISQVHYKTRTGPGLIIKRGLGLVIKHGLMDCTYATTIGLLGCQQSARTISKTHLCGITALFGVFLETKKHQNLIRLSN